MSPNLGHESRRANRDLRMAESNKFCAVQIETCALAVALAELSNHNLRKTPRPTAASQQGKPRDMVGHFPHRLLSASWFWSCLVLCTYLCSLKDSLAPVQHCCGVTGSFFLPTEYLLVQKETCSIRVWWTESPFPEQPCGQTNHWCWKPTFKALAWIASGVSVGNAL